MTIREGDRIALIGAVVDTLHAAVTVTSSPTLTVHDASFFVVRGRYLIDTEVVVVSATDAATENVTVARGHDSLAATHAADASIYEVDGLFVVVDAQRIAGLLAPLRAPDRFVVVPHVLGELDDELRAQAQAGTVLAGSYQDGGGPSVAIERDGFTLNSRLGLIILPRAEGGHWELGVRDV